MALDPVDVAIIVVIVAEVAIGRSSRARLGALGVLARADMEASVGEVSSRDRTAGLVEGMGNGGRWEEGGRVPSSNVGEEEPCGTGPSVVDTDVGTACVVMWDGDTLPCAPAPLSIAEGLPDKRDEAGASGEGFITAFTTRTRSLRHSRTCPSALPESTIPLLGSARTHSTGPRWPRNTWASHLPRT